MFGTNQSLEVTQLADASSAPQLKRCAEIMNSKCQDLLRKVSETADFWEMEFKDINERNGYGDNALHCVAVWGDVEGAKVLVENGIELNVQGEHGCTALHEAIMQRRIEMVEYLLSVGANPEIECELGTTNDLISRIENKNVREVIECTTSRWR